MQGLRLRVLPHGGGRAEGRRQPRWVRQSHKVDMYIYLFTQFINLGRFSIDIWVSGASSLDQGVCFPAINLISAIVMRFSIGVIVCFSMGVLCFSVLSVSQWVYCVFLNACRYVMDARKLVVQVARRSAGHRPTPGRCTYIFKHSNTQICVCSNTYMASAWTRTER